MYTLVAICHPIDSSEIIKKVFYRPDQESFIRSIVGYDELWDFGIEESQYNDFYGDEMGYVEAEDIEVFDIV